MDNPHTPEPAPSKVRKVRGTGEDMDAAMLWLRGTLRHLDPDAVEEEIRQVPALVALLSYRAAVLRSQRGPEA